MKFTEPEFKLIRFSIMDVIQTSGIVDIGDNEDDKYTDKGDNVDNLFNGDGEIQ